MMKAIVVVLVLAAVSAEQQEIQATVKMTPHDVVMSNVTGNLKLTQRSPSSEVVITGTLTGLTPGLHGFHIHEKGDLSDGCTSTKAHFNPFNKSHGAPGDEDRHLGDLGNVEANSQGIANIHLSDTLISLSGPNSIIGRSIVIHSDPDDLGKTDHPLSKTTGNAGSRLACGVIGAV